MTEFIKKVGREVKKAYDEAQREAQRQSQRSKSRPRTRPAPAAKICEFWSCQEEIRDDHFLCLDHYSRFKEDSINECPSCGRYKDALYETCLECNAKLSPRTTRESRAAYRTRRDVDPAWEAGDAETETFFAYVLKLDAGEFYAGQTRDLRARLMEHRDGKVLTTRGRHPKLQWFAIVPTRDEAVAAEKRMKALVKGNPREVRKLIIKFQDMYEELDFD